MNLDLTKEEATLLKNLLQEETFTVEDMALNSKGKDNKELEKQLTMMKAILAKLVINLIAKLIL